MEEQKRGWPIFVWYDLNTCGLPSGYDALGVFQAIKSAMNGLGFCGSLNVEAVAEKGQWVSLDSVERLTVTEIQFVPVVLNVKNGGNGYEIYNRINKWKRSHHPPGVVVVISCDRGYAKALLLRNAGFGLWTSLNNNHIVDK